MTWWDDIVNTTKDAYSGSVGMLGGGGDPSQGPSLDQLKADLESGGGYINQRQDVDKIDLNKPWDWLAEQIYANQQKKLAEAAKRIKYEQHDPSLEVDERDMLENSKSIL